MSRLTIRKGIADWLRDNVSGLNTVYAGLPRVIPATAFFPNTPGSVSGAVCCVHLPADDEARISSGGEHAGWKRLDHTVELQLFFRHVAPATIAAGDGTADAGIVATEAFDELVEDLKARIRADRTAGGAAWQWGESRLSGRYGDLVERGDALDLWARITTVATEWLPT